jgi:zinc transport system substrate-binding protein
MRPADLLPIVLTLSLTSCGGGESVAPRAAVIEDAVYTTFHPTTWMAQCIASGQVPVHCPLPAGADAIFWRPSREVIKRYQSARLVVVNGAEFEKWVPGASLARSRTVDTAASFKDQFITIEGVTHSHGGSGGTEHTHEGTDGHTWVAPELAKLQARAIADAMKRAWPEHAAAFDQGLAEVTADLEKLRVRLFELTPKLKDVTLLASHPAYNYLARGMGWTIKSLVMDPESPLPGKTLAEIALKLQGAGEKRIMLWGRAPIPATAGLLRERFNLASVEFSPAENLDAGASGYLDVMMANVKRLSDVLNRP